MKYQLITDGEVVEVFETMAEADEVMVSHADDCHFVDWNDRGFYHRILGKTVETYIEEVDDE